MEIALAAIFGTLVYLCIVIPPALQEIADALRSRRERP